MDVTKIEILRCARLLIQCAAGSREFSIGYRDLLKNKKIHSVFTSGQTVGKNNETLTTSPFYLSLVDNNTLIFDIPSSQLVYNTLKLIKLANFNIDWQSSNIVFPTNLAAATNVELIVYYADENPPQEIVG
jgi:hypothetical protein